MTGLANRSTGDVSALIVAYGAVATLSKTVQHAVDAGIGEIVIWDNSTDDGDRVAIAGLACERVFVHQSSENLGFGRGCNRAAELASRDLLLFLNPDCLVDTETVRSLMDVLDDPRVGATAPRMLYPDGRTGFAGGGKPSMLKELAAASRLDDLLPSRARDLAIRLVDRIASGDADHGLNASTQMGEPIALDWVSGFCMMVRRDQFHECGGFDERFFLYFEDVEFCERLNQTGLTVVLDRRVSAIHYESSTSGQSKSSHYWRGFSIYWAIRGARLRSRLSGRIAARKS